MHGFYIFYPIFHCGLWSITRKIETRNARRWRQSMAIASCQYFFGGKYDLIQLHRYTSKCSELFFHHKNTITTSNFYSNLKKQWKWYDFLLFQLFGPVLFWAHIYGRSQLAGTSLADQLCPYVKTYAWKKRQLLDLAILRLFLAIVSPTTFISFTKLRFWQSFWDA